MESSVNVIRWMEPRWSWFNATRPYLIKMGLLSIWMYVRLIVVGGLLGGACLFAFYLVAPTAPRPPGLVRAVFCVAFALPLVLAFHVLAFLLIPQWVGVHARGFVVTGQSSYTFKADRIVWATVKPIDGGRFVLSIEYRGERTTDRRDFGLSEKVDPVELEGLLERLRWPAPPPAVRETEPRVVLPPLRHKVPQREHTG